MPLVDILSFKLRDADPDTKTIPLYLLAGGDIADIQTMVDDIAGDINTVTGVVIESVTLTRNLTLPAGLRTTPVAGSEVQRGALLKYGAEDTDYTHSVFVPGWANAGFAGNTVVNSGDYATFIGKLVATYGTSEIEITDENGNALVEYISGKKTFRK